MTPSIITRKTMNLYVAYAPEFDMGAFGNCWEEAFNTLMDDIQSRPATKLTGEERKPHGSA